MDTIKELFEGSEPLFRGLAVHDEWDWSARRPVVRLDFSQGDCKQADYLHANVSAQLDRAERRAAVAPRHATAPERFGDLIEALHERTGRRVAVLVDEYDKPILDALEKPATARANRDYLRGLYSTVKFADAHVAFSLFTGVSKFSKVSLFSGLNNLRDITLDWAAPGAGAAGTPLNEGRGVNPGGTPDGFLRPMLSQHAQRRPGREPRRHRHAHANADVAVVAQRRPGREPRRHRRGGGLEAVAGDRSTKAGA